MTITYSDLIEKIKHVLMGFLTITIALCVLAPISQAQTSASDDTTPVASANHTLVQKAREAAQQAMNKTSELTEVALSMLGIQYKFGGAAPESGFDCSGLVRFVFQQATGISLPHNALAQSQSGREVSTEELRPGDLVFFNTRKFAFSHVGIYLGDNKFVHAPRKGKPVQVVEFDNPYWQRAFNGARRIFDSAPQLFAPSANAAILSAPEMKSEINPAD